MMRGAYDRPLELRLDLAPGLNLDAELDRRKQHAIADPESTESRTSTEYAERIAQELGWDADAQHVYALALRSVTLPKQRAIPVTIPTPGEPDHRFNTSIIGFGNCLPPEGLHRR